MQDGTSLPHPLPNGTALETHAPYAQWTETGTVGVDIVPASVQVVPSAAYMELGESVPLTALATGADGLPLAASFGWTTTDPAVAVVTVSGNVSATGTGLGDIVATASGVSGTAAIQVGVTAFVRTSNGRLQFSDAGPATHTLARYQGRVVATPIGEPSIGTPTNAVRLPNGRVLISP